MTPEQVSLVVTLCLVAWVLPMIIGAMVATHRHRSPWAGVALGAFLGWLGVVLALFLPEGHPPAYSRRSSRPWPRRRRSRGSW